MLPLTVGCHDWCVPVCISCMSTQLISLTVVSHTVISPLHLLHREYCWLGSWGRSGMV
jgi:hypothetical protein